MAGLLSRATTDYAVGSFRGTDTSYVRCRRKGFLPRSKHVLISEFTERRLDGSLAAPVARASGIAAGTRVASLGQHASAGGAVSRAALLVNTDIGFIMLNEFWPEIKRSMLFRHKQASGPAPNHAARPAHTRNRHITRAPCLARNVRISARA
jgi:hypothetical protein